MAYGAITALLPDKELTHRELAEEFARTVQRSGGCVPSFLIPKLVDMLDAAACLDGVKKLMAERDELRKRLDDEAEGK